MRRWPILLVLFACGDDDGGGSVDAPLGSIADGPVASIDARPGAGEDGPPLTAGCSVTLSGAVTGTYGCTVTAGKNDGEDFSAFGLSAPGSGTLTALILTVGVEGTLAVGDHLSDVTEAAASVTAGVDSWVATRGSANVGNIGTLTITSLDPVSSGGGVTVWAPHGSVTAMLVGLTNPATQVTFTATF